MVNIGNEGVSWCGLLESRVWQKCLWNFHCLLMKACYSQVPFFIIVYIFILVRMYWK